MNPELIDVGYLIAAMCFILALKLMNSPITARKGNWLSMAGMGLALLVTIFHPDIKTTNLIYILGAVAVGTVTFFGRSCISSPARQYSTKATSTVAHVSCLS